MKKFLFSALGIILFAVIAEAQNTKTESTPRTFIVLTAGPAFPMGDFASTSYDNDEGGWARDGYTIEAKIGHHLDRAFGLAGSIEYGHFAVDNSYYGYDGSSSDYSITPWQFYGIMIGPMITTKLSPRSSIDFSVLSGIAFAKSPEEKHQGEVVTTSDNTTAVPMKFAADFRFKFGNNMYAFAGANYQYMRPKFTVQEPGYGEGNEVFTYTFKQKMSVVGLNVGIGFGF